MDSSRRIFIKTAGIGGLGLGLLPVLNRLPGVPLFYKSFTGSLPRATPESQGVSSKAISRFIADVNASGLAMHSFMLVRHGYVIAEGWWKPFEPAFKHTLFSLSKSFTSTAIGLLVKEGKLDIDTPVLSFFPKDAPPNPDENLKKMTVRHLLTMTTGHEEDSISTFFTSKQPWTRSFLAQPVKFEPGTHFTYDTGATYMLGAVLYKITGEILENYLTPRLFQPLNIQGSDWGTSPQGLNTGGYGLRVKTEDIAKFGQLYLQKGKWNGREILTESWVAEATGYQTSSRSDNGVDWEQGYGYQFWRRRHDIYSGDGRYGQYCIVMPDQDAILAVTGEIPGMQKPLDIIWDDLLPAMEASPLAENPADLTALKKGLAALLLPFTRGSTHSSLSAKYNGRPFNLDKNVFGARKLRFDFSKEGCSLVTNIGEKEITLRFGWENWVLNGESQVYLFHPNSGFFMSPSKIAGSATWLGDNILRLDARLVEAMEGDKITCTFAGEKVSISFLNSIGEKTIGYPDAPEKRISLTGTISSLPSDD